MTPEEASKVCPSCGGKITEKDITENSCFTQHKDLVTCEKVCESCSVLEKGVDKKIFDKTVKALTPMNPNIIKDINDNDFDIRIEARSKMREYVYLAHNLLLNESKP